MSQFDIDNKTNEVLSNKTGGTFNKKKPEKKTKEQMREESINAMMTELETIFKQIKEFALTENPDGTELLLQTELTTKQRSVVHEFVKQLKANIVSESVELKGSSNKKIKIRRTNSVENSVENSVDTEHESKSDVEKLIAKPIVKSLRNESVDLFAQHWRVPIPCPRLDMIEYYTKLFDPFYDTVNGWDIFTREFQEFDLTKEISQTTQKIKELFEKNKEYKEMMETKLNGVSFKLKKDVYNLASIGKYFMSVDIKSANFTMLRDKCPTLFQKTDTDGSVKLLSWYEYVKQFTKSEFIAKSKHFREVMFGLTGYMNKAGTLQEIFMDDIHNIVSEWAVKNSLKLDLKMKFADENVYQLDDYTKIMEHIENLKELLGINAEKLHIRVFRVDQIASKSYFVKTFMYNTDLILTSTSSLDDNKRVNLKSKIEFKKVPKYFIPQVIKWYFKQKIESNDLRFMHEGLVAMYESSIFD